MDSRERVWMISADAERDTSASAISPRRGSRPAGRRRDGPLLAKGIVEKDNVLAYFGGRDECEIISMKVSISSVTKLGAIILGDRGARCPSEGQYLSPPRTRLIVSAAPSP